MKKTKDLEICVDSNKYKTVFVSYKSIRYAIFFFIVSLILTVFSFTTDLVTHAMAFIPTATALLTLVLSVKTTEDMINADRRRR